MISNGLPYNEIPGLEESEFNDWLAASQALDIDRKLVLMNVAASPHWKQSARSSEFNRLKNEQLILLGDNPYKVNEDEIKSTRERLKSGGKVRRIKNGGNNKRNTRKTQT